MISVELKTIFNLLYDAICIFIVLVIANLLALNYSFYEKYLMFGGWHNYLIKLFLGTFLVGFIIALLFYFEKHNKNRTLRSKYSYLFFFYYSRVLVLFTISINFIWMQPKQQRRAICYIKNAIKYNYIFYVYVYFDNIKAGEYIFF